MKNFKHALMLTAILTLGACVAKDTDVETMKSTTSSSESVMLESNTDAQTGGVIDSNTRKSTATEKVEVKTMK